MLKLLFAISVSVFIFLLLGLYIRRMILPGIEVQKRMQGISQNGAQGKSGAAVRSQARLDWRRRAAGRNLAEIPFSHRVLFPLAQSVEKLVRSMRQI